MLSDSQLGEYAENGFLALGKVMSDDQLHALQARVDDLTGGSTPNERIGYQTEKAFRKRGGTKAKYAWQGPSDHYRKLTNMDEDPVFFEYFAHPTFRTIVRQLIGPDANIRRAFGMLKPAFDGSPLDWHQDAGPGYPVDGDRFCTVWTALDAATEANGALVVLSGSHRLGLVPRTDGRRELRDAVAGMAGQEVTLNAEPGEALLLNNLVLHSSGSNPTPHSRRAVTVCYVDANAELQPSDPPILQAELRSMPQD
jgi:ectoine hydroxylase-related dioxygenase (phytanoyl-CoA dioxygenase family)